MQRPPKRQIPYLVHNILPSHGIHLIVGPSGSGKTTWTFQMLEAWSKGEKVLNNPTTPGPWAYVSVDRTLEETWDTIDRVFIDPPGHEHIMVWDELGLEHTATALKQFIDKNQSLYHGGLLVIDGFNMLMGGYDSNKSRDVQQYMKAIQNCAKRINCAILGIVHPAKLKTNEKFQEDRWNIAGSTMWGHVASTIITLTTVKNERREMRVMPRNAARSVYFFEEDTVGRLICVEDETANNEDLANLMMDRLMPRLERLGEFRTSYVVQYAEEENVSQRSAERWLTEQVKLGRLERGNKGFYRIPTKQ